MKCSINLQNVRRLKNLNQMQINDFRRKFHKVFGDA